MTKRLEQGKRGREYWMALEAQYPIHRDAVVLLLSPFDMEWNEQALRYLGELCQMRGRTKAIVLHSMNQNQPLFQENQQEWITFHLLSLEEREELLAFYELYQFTDLLYILSIEEPFTSKFSHLERNHILNKEEILRYCIYQLTD